MILGYDGGLFFLFSMAIAQCYQRWGELGEPNIEPTTQEGQSQVKSSRKSEKIDGRFLDDAGVNSSSSFVCLLGEIGFIVSDNRK